MNCVAGSPQALELWHAFERVDRLQVPQNLRESLDASLQTVLFLTPPYRRISATFYTELTVQNVQRFQQRELSDRLNVMLVMRTTMPAYRGSAGGNDSATYPLLLRRRHFVGGIWQVSHE